MILGQITQEQLDQVYAWVDQVPLSRKKGNISRDFSDAVLVAEIVHFYDNKRVQLHNYVQANSVDKKIINWKLLNKKVLKKLNCQIDEVTIQNLAKAVPFQIQKFLLLLKSKFEHSVQTKGSSIMNLQGPHSNAERQLQKSNQLEELKDIVVILKQKIDRLEQKLEEKDKKISQLQDLLRQRNF